MVAKASTKRKSSLTDSARHERFVETAHQIGAEEGPDAFDKAFERVVKPKKLGNKG
jgi:hypothetical protein